MLPHAKAEAVLGVIRVIHNNGMRVVSGVACQKFWDIIHGHVIHMALHWAKEVMVKVGHADGLVENQVILYIPIGRVIKGQDTADSVVGLGTVGRVIADHFNWSVVILNDQCTFAEYSCISMQVKF